jgi:hypothetical protein
MIYVIAANPRVKGIHRIPFLMFKKFRILFPEYKIEAISVFGRKFSL